MLINLVACFYACRFFANFSIFTLKSD